MQSANLKRVAAAKGVSTELDLVRPYLEKIWEADSLPLSGLSTSILL